MSEIPRPRTRTDAERFYGPRHFGSGGRGYAIPITGVDIAAFLGQPDDEQIIARAEETLPVIIGLISAYTRDQGVDEIGIPEPALATVVITATARLMANPEQLPHTVGSVSYQGGFAGWTLAELAVLNRYRKRAA